MTAVDHDTVLDLLRGVAGERYRLRWTDEMTTRGDFDGRDRALDVFDIPIEDQLSFLRAVRPYRENISQVLGGSVVFIFHTPEATAEYYEHLLGAPPRIENSFFNGDEGIVADLINGVITRPLVLALA